DLRLDAVVVIGGDGTMSIAHRLQEMGMNAVGVPKTIDNDIVGTERTFGFDTAVAIATDAVDRLQTTGQSHGRVMILETMGRYAGWIALEAGVAGGGDVILVPEMPYEIDEVVRVCKQREHRQRFTIIVVAEGAKPKDGEMVVRERIETSPDPIRLGGVGNLLREQLAAEIDSEIRTTILGHIQRGGSPTAYDRILSTNFGCYAARMVARKEYGRMVAMQHNRFTSISLHEVANKTRCIPEDSFLIQAAVGVGTSFGVRGISEKFEAATT
ncbi:MAG: 6-phosphofructokinase, partial [Bradymonadaceae bacterium]